jgi:hypothetical protein
MPSPVKAWENIEEAFRKFYCHNRWSKEDPRWLPILCNKHSQDRNFTQELDGKGGLGTFLREKNSRKRVLDNFWALVNDAIGTINPLILTQCLSIPAMAKDVLSKTVVQQSFEADKLDFQQSDVTAGCAAQLKKYKEVLQKALNEESAVMNDVTTSSEETEEQKQEKDENIQKATQSVARIQDLLKTLEDTHKKLMDGAGDEEDDESVSGDSDDESIADENTGDATAEGNTGETKTKMKKKRKMKSCDAVILYLMAPILQWPKTYEQSSAYRINQVNSKLFNFIFFDFFSFDIIFRVQFH